MNLKKAIDRLPLLEVSLAFSEGLLFPKFGDGVSNLARCEFADGMVERGRTLR